MDKTPEIVEKIAFWDLAWDSKQSVAQTMIDDVNTTVEYRSQMILSGLIATLWLLINATPVVIGAMLIAPIMRPIQWVAFAITTGNQKLFSKSLILLILSILSWVVIAILFTRLIPLTEVTNEIAMRTEPTLVDLWIAFASWLVAFLALWYKKMWAWLAWVAMAASLVPPLSVIGIGIAFGSWTIWRGSTILFMTNLIAIIIGGIVIFYIFWFSPNQKSDIRRSILNIWFVIGMMILLAIPLTTSLINITKNIASEKTIQRITTQYINDIDKKIHIESLDIQGSTEKSISLSLKVPQEQVDKLTDEGKQILTQDLAAALQKDVALDVTIVPITSVTAKQAKELSPEEKIRQHVKQYLETIFESKASLLWTDYFTDSKRFAQITLYTEQKIADKAWFKQSLLAYLQEQEDLVDILSVQRQENRTEPEKVREQKDDDLDIASQAFKDYFSNKTTINNIDLVYLSAEDEAERNKILLALNLTTTEPEATLEKKLKSWKLDLQEKFATQVNLEVVIEYLETFRY